MKKQKKAAPDFVLRFGPLVPAIETQLDTQGYAYRIAGDLTRFQRIADSITNLSMFGYILDHEIDRCRRRLTNEIGESTERSRIGKKRAKK